MRTLLSILLIGVPVTLILSLVGLTHGLLQDSEQRTRGIGADVIVRGTNAGATFNFTGATLSEGFVAFLQKQPHVKLAMGVINHPIELPLVVTGIDMAKFNAMSGGFTYLAGGPFQQPDDVIVDRYYAAQRHLHVGDHVTIMYKPWRVAGIVEGGKLSHIFVSLPVLQDHDSATGKLSQIYLQLDNPANTSAVIADLKKTLGPEYPIWSMADLTSMLSIDKIQGLSQFILVIMGIGVVIGFAVVCLSMYMAVLQRTREIGILKSLGASKGFILRIILMEALLLGVGGTVLGILLSFGACWLIGAIVPASIPMVIVPYWWPIAGIVTLVGTGLGALYPGLTAARQDPIEALAYE
ncbi:MAG TPA: FtsX-like permease family protein [Bryobacteraceae bacterium]|nr:FtsX-like permease family protein [Bryobacteraceae bacterium]